MSRTINSIKNMKIGFITQVLILLINFISRKVFILTLSTEYLGLSGVFSNVLSMLSLAELGIGTAITFSLYKPLSIRDYNQVNALMQLYKKTYTLIGIVVASLGSMLLPLLPYIIKDIPDIPYINFIYIMYVFNASISYFFSYKSSLIIADQKRYIYTKNHFIINLLFNIIQMILLIMTHNYIIYMIVMILKTLVENITISIKADNIYPFLKQKNEISVQKETKSEILKNIRAMVFHKIGGIVVMSTDNLLISTFIGVIDVAIYSNYLLIINALNMIFNTVVQSITASIGNLGAVESNKKNIKIFERINFLFSWICGFSSISLLILFNPFIKIWLGDEYLFSNSIVFLIVLNFYITSMRRSVLVFRDALGLYWYDRYKPLVESLINLIVSIILIYYMGIKGIFIGTLISTLTTSFWVEPYILYKYGFDRRVSVYIRNYFKYFLSTILVGILTVFSCSFISGESLPAFILKCIVCLTIPNISYGVIFYTNDEFKYYIKLFSSVLNSLKIKFYK